MNGVLFLLLVIWFASAGVESASSRYYRGTLLATSRVNIHPDVWGRMLARSRMAKYDELFCLSKGYNDILI